MDGKQQNFSLLFRFLIKQKREKNFCFVLSHWFTYCMYWVLQGRVVGRCGMKRFNSVEKIASRSFVNIIESVFDRLMADIYQWNSIWGSCVRGADGWKGVIHKGHSNLGGKRAENSDFPRMSFMYNIHCISLSETQQIRVVGCWECDETFLLRSRLQSLI